MSNSPVRRGRSFLINASDTVTYPYEGFSVELDQHTGAAADGSTVTIGGKVYTLQTTLTDVDGNVWRGGGTRSDIQANLQAAINLTGTPGTDYALSMTAHSDGLYADLGAGNFALHLLSPSTAMTVSTSVSGNIRFEDVFGAIVTEMLKQPSGDWTHTAALSAALLSQGCRVTGFTHDSGSATGLTGLFTFNHALTPAMSAAVQHGTGGVAIGETKRLDIVTGIGLAAKLTAVTSTSGYVHWEGFRRI